MFRQFFISLRLFFSRLIDAEQPQNLTRTEFGWTQYHNLEEIYAWLDGLLEKHSDVLTNYNYGTSYENRTLRAVKLSHKEVWTKILWNLKIFKA